MIPRLSIGSGCMEEILSCLVCSTVEVNWKKIWRQKVRKIVSCFVFSKQL